MKKLAILLLVVLVPIGLAYGQGLGLETIKLNVGDKKIAVTTQIIPTEFSESAQKQIVMTVTDSITTKNIDAVLLVSMNHDGKEIFKEYFATTNGVLRMDVSPTSDSRIKITGLQEKTYNAWHSGSKPLEISGPILDSGGLYRFDVEIKSLDSQPITKQVFSTYITAVTDHQFSQPDKAGKNIEFGIKSYYDRVLNFQYSPEANTISFDMPFDWDEQNIVNTQVVHEEVHFPKSFADFMVPSYAGTVNGIDLFKSGVVIDDYSVDGQRLVHVILSQDTIRYLKQTQKANGIEKPQGMKFVLKIGNEIKFPVTAQTKDGSLQVDMSWDPIAIEPGKSTKFIYTFRDGKTGDLVRNTSYDLVLVQNGKELYKKSANAQIGGDYIDYTFTESQTGQTTIQFNNLRGTGQGTEFTISVVPEFGQIAMIVLAVSTVSIGLLQRFSGFSLKQQ